MEYWLEILAGFLFTHELVVSEIERVNAANEYDFDINQRLFTYHTEDFTWCIRFIIGLHVHKESKFLFNNNSLLNRLKSVVYKSIMKGTNEINFPSR